MSEVIVITSGKGGVGKTTTTANIGTGLAQLNKKVVMIDTDIGRHGPAGSGLCAGPQEPQTELIAIPACRAVPQAARQVSPS